MKKFLKGLNPTGLGIDELLGKKTQRMIKKIFKKVPKKAKDRYNYISTFPENTFDCKQNKN